MLSSLTFLNARNVPSSEKYLQMLIRLLQYLTPDSLQIDEVIREVSTAVCCDIVLYCNMCCALFVIMLCSNMCCVLCNVWYDIVQYAVCYSLYYSILHYNIVYHLISHHLTTHHLLGARGRQSIISEHATHRTFQCCCLLSGIKNHDNVADIHGCSPVCIWSNMYLSIRSILSNDDRSRGIE